MGYTSGVMKPTPEENLESFVSDTLGESGGITDVQVKAIAKDLRFTLCAVTPVSETAYRQELEQWLVDEKHGSMHYLADHFDLRVDPKNLLEGAVSIISVADRYPHELPEGYVLPEAPYGKIARYAWADDYHKTIKKRLFKLVDLLKERFPGYAFKCATDTAPILEREHATRAGLGWTGKHTLLINPNKGSYLLLGQIITTLPIKVLEAGQVMDHCGSCRKCIEACPTDAIDEGGYAMDGSKCISYLTLEHRGAIPEGFYEPMGDWIAGCDICQEVCPHNQPLTLDKKQGRVMGADTEAFAVAEGYTPRPPAPGLGLLEILNWTTEDRQKTFTKSALKRMKLKMVQRNAMIAAGNYLSGADCDEVVGVALREKIIELAGDDGQHKLVQVTAQTVLKKIDFLE